MSKLKQFSSITLISLMLFSATSCSTLDTITQSPDTRTTAEKTKTYSESVDFNSISFQSWLNTMPENGKPRFFAYNSRLGNREDELPQCLLNASKQASKFIAVKAISKFYSKQVNSSIKYAQDLDILWDEELAVALIDRLTVVEIMQDHDGTYMIVELEGNSIAADIAYSNIIPLGEPSWINKVPEIPGYITGVGTVQQKGSMAKSFEASDNQALEEIARQLSVETFDTEKLLETGSGSASINENLEISEAEISGFYVIERWHSPDKRFFYSLAIAPQQ